MLYKDYSKPVIRIPTNKPGFHGSCHLWLLITAHLRFGGLKS